MSGHELLVALVGIAICLNVIGWILFVLFGQMTVRRLRKNPATRNELGMEFASGYDIFNVAGALAMPRWINRKLRNSSLTWLYANADVLYQHTNLFDRVLARIFYLFFSVSGFGFIILGMLKWCGAFD